MRRLVGLLSVITMRYRWIIITDNGGTVNASWWRKRDAETYRVRHNIAGRVCKLPCTHRGDGKMTRWYVE